MKMSIPKLFLGNQSAFTLLEVLISITIIGIALSSLFSSQSQSLSLVMESKFYTTASMLANLKIAELESMEEVTDDDGEFGEDFPNYKYSIEVKDIDPGESELLDELHSALQKIVLLVSMGENDVFSYQISFYKRSKEGDEIFSDFRK